MAPQVLALGMPVSPRRSSSALILSPPQAGLSERTARIFSSTSAGVWPNGCPGRRDWSSSGACFPTNPVPPAQVAEVPALRRFFYKLLSLIHNSSALPWHNFRLFLCVFYAFYSIRNCYLSLFRPVTYLTSLYISAARPLSHGCGVPLAGAVLLGMTEKGLLTPIPRFKNRGMLLF